MLSPSILQAPFPTLGQDGAISSDHVIANQLGVEVLQRGGNAIDAALAVSLALGLCCPQYTGIGGGGFALVWMPGWDCVRCLDYRETAPHLATRDMFVCPTGVSQDCCLNERGQVSSTVVVAPSACPATWRAGGCCTNPLVICPGEKFCYW